MLLVDIKALQVTLGANRQKLHRPWERIQTEQLILLGFNVALPPPVSGMQLPNLELDSLVLFDNPPCNGLKLFVREEFARMDDEFKLVSLVLEGIGVGCRLPLIEVAAVHGP